MATYNDLKTLEESNLQHVNTVILHTFDDITYAFKKVNQMVSGSKTIHKSGLLCYSSDQYEPVLYPTAREAYFNDFIHLNMQTS